MSTRWSRRMMAFVVCFVLALPALLPGTLSGQAVQDGKWKVTPSLVKFVYFNATPASQKVMVTVCSVSGGSVTVTLQGAAQYSLAVPDCVTVSGSVSADGKVTIELASGTSASGTYSISLFP